MIRSFRSKGAEALFHDMPVRRFQAIERPARRTLQLFRRARAPSRQVLRHFSRSLARSAVRLRASSGAANDMDTCRTDGADPSRLIVFRLRPGGQGNSGDPLAVAGAVVRGDHRRLGSVSAIGTPKAPPDSGFDLSSFSGETSPAPAGTWSTSRGLRSNTGSP